MPARNGIEITKFDKSRVADLDRLFGSDAAAAACWCMWFIVPVQTFHASGGAGNRAAFSEIMERDPNPMGLIARSNGEPVGWCALGPRSRFARAVRTPTYTGRDSAEDASVWLLPCLYVAPGSRGMGVAERLAEAAIQHAANAGAEALEAFPLAGSKRQSRDVQVGFEPMFAKLGFEVVRRPSANRVLMRRQLTERHRRHG